jgi:Anti-sigma factor NepR
MQRARMTKRDAPKAPDRDQPADAPKGPAAEEAFAIQGHIGRQLRGIFEDVVAEPVPERFRKLLEELSRKQGKS